MTTWIKQAREQFGIQDPSDSSKATIDILAVNRAAVASLPISDAAARAMQACFTTSGPRRGLLKRKAPKRDVKVAWTAMRGGINPNLENMFGVLLLSDREKVIKVEIDEALMLPGVARWLNGWCHGFAELQIYPEGRHEYFRAESLKRLVETGSVVERKEEKAA